MSAMPTTPGYYWAKLKTPSHGFFYCEGLPPEMQGVRIEPEGGSWQSLDWEIVQVNDNNGEGDEEFSVDVFGVPVSQWPLDFYWGPKIELTPPAEQVQS